MPKIDLAELFLSLVTTRERAASLAGDLVEDANSPRQFWFWVARTAFSQAWRQITEAPFRNAGAVIRAMSVEWGLGILWGLALLLLFDPATDFSRAVFHQDLPNWLTRSLPYCVSYILVPFELGRSTLKRYHGREMAGTLTLAIFHAATNLCAGLICWLFARSGGEAHADITFVVRLIDWNGYIYRTLLIATYYLTLYQILIVGGVASARAKSLKPFLAS